MGEIFVGHIDFGGIQINNMTNTHSRSTEAFAMCSYSTVWRFNFFYPFALLSTLTYLDGHGTKEMISPGYHLYISEENYKN